MNLTESEKLTMIVQIRNHHPFWKNKSNAEAEKLQEVDEFILIMLFKESLN